MYKNTSLKLDSVMHMLQRHTLNLGDTTGEHADILLGFIPEAKAGVTGEHILALMFESEKWAL